RARTLSDTPALVVLFHYVYCSAKASAHGPARAQSTPLGELKFSTLQIGNRWRDFRLASRDREPRQNQQYRGGGREKERDLRAHAEKSGPENREQHAEQHDHPSAVVRSARGGEPDGDDDRK